jgi:hypothetical protein
MQETHGIMQIRLRYFVNFWCQAMSFVCISMENSVFLQALFLLSP